jgi:hypothetical protein
MQNEVNQSNLNHSFTTYRTIINTIKTYLITLIRNTNASAESFNAKIKAFDFNLTSLRNVEFFPFLG